jgi:hypothetical protein
MAMHSVPRACALAFVFFVEGAGSGNGQSHPFQFLCRSSDSLLTNRVFGAAF